MSTVVNKPRVDMAFVSPQTGFLTQFGVSLLNGLYNRTGAGDGVDVIKLRDLLLQQFQDDREAPLPGYAQPSIDPERSDESPPSQTIIAAYEDVGIAGLLFEALAQIETLSKRINALENNP